MVKKRSDYTDFSVAVAFHTDTDSRLMIHTNTESSLMIHFLGRSIRRLLSGHSIHKKRRFTKSFSYMFLVWAVSCRDISYLKLLVICSLLSNAMTIKAIVVNNSLDFLLRNSQNDDGKYFV